MVSFNRFRLATIDKAFADTIRVCLSLISSADRRLPAPIYVICVIWPFFLFYSESTIILEATDEIAGEAELLLDQGSNVISPSL
jgi:hypothetical protein